MSDEICKKNILCRLEIHKNTNLAIVEACVNCGKRVIYPKNNSGTINDKKYVKDHLRDTLQPWGKTRKLFLRIYGNEPINAIRPHAERWNQKKKLKDLREELKEKRRGRPPLVKRVGFQRIPHI